MKNIADILHNNFERINEDDLIKERLFVEKDGELIPLVQIIDEKYEHIFENVKKLNKSKIPFVLIYQDALFKMFGELSPSSIKVLMYLISKMKYKNTVFGFKYQELTDTYGMSYRTVTNAMKELQDKNYVKKDGKRTNLVYHISPTVCWKGSVYNMYQKLKMFTDEQGDQGESAHTDE